MANITAELTATVADVSAVARARKAAWLGGFGFRSVGVVAFGLATFDVSIWLLEDRDPLHVAVAVASRTSPFTALWSTLAVGAVVGLVLAACCWRLASLHARGSRVAAAVAVIVAGAGLLGAGLTAIRQGGAGQVFALTFLSIPPAALLWSAVVVLRTPGGRDAPIWAADRERWLCHRYRRRPLRVGVAALLVWVLFGPLLLLLELPEPAQHQAGVLAMLLVFAAVRRSRRRSMLTAWEVAEADPRDPVVYLRSFSADRLIIPAVPTRHPPRPDATLGLNVVPATPLEEVMAETLWRYGPVLAAAEPHSDSPPLGAARAQLPAEQWKETLHQWLAGAGVIAVGVGRGRGLMWELVRACELGMANRVVFVVPPAALLAPPLEAGTSVRAYRERQRQELEGSWAAVCDAVDHCSAMCLPRDLDLAGARVVVPGAARRNHAGPRVFTAKHSGDFSYEAALDVAIEFLRSAA